MSTNATHTPADVEILRKLVNGSRGRGHLPKGYLRLRRLGLIEQHGAGFYGWTIVLSAAGRAAITKATGAQP